MSLRVFSTAYVVVRDNCVVTWGTNMTQLHKNLSPFTDINYSYLTTKLKNTDLFEWDGYKIYKLYQHKETKE